MLNENQKQRIIKAIYEAIKRYLERKNNDEVQKTGT